VTLVAQQSVTVWLRKSERVNWEVRTMKPLIIAGLLALAATPALGAEGAGAIPDAQVEGDARFFPFAMPLELELTGAANVSGWLEKPAGARGFVRVEGGHLVDGAGRRLRLLGMNVCYSMDFPLRQEAELTARRLSALGINCVRFHHMDQQSEPAGIWDRRYDDSRHLSAEMLDRLDYFIYQLKQNGVYSDLNLRVLRPYTAADGFPEPRPGTDKGVDNYLPEMIALQKEYARALLTHRNPYTSTRYVDEPAVALVEINNENSLYILWNEGSLLNMLSGEGLSTLPARYTEPLCERWNAWLRKRYPTADGLRESWTGGVKQASDEGFAGGALPILRSALGEYGPEALKDGGRFLAEVAAGYYAEMCRYLKEDLGLKAPVIGTQVRFGSPVDQAGMDVMDVHSYWHHPVFLAQPWQEPWAIGQQALVNHLPGSLEVFCLGLEGKPLVCSEYCHPFPNAYAAEQGPLTAAYAAFQDMDGVFYFTWAHDREALRDSTLRPFFDHHSHVGKLVALPFASALFVRGDAQPARNGVFCTLPTDALSALLGTHDSFTLLVRDDVERGKDVFLSQPEAAVLRQMVETAGLPVLPPSPLALDPRAMLLHGFRLRLGDRFQQPHVVLPADNVYRSDTGQIRWDASEAGRGYVTIDTPAAKGAVGFLSGRDLRLGSVSIRVADTFLDGFAVVTLVALEGEIGRPGFRGLLSCVGHVQNQGQRWKDARKTSLGSVGSGPLLVEGISLELTLEATPGVRAWALDPAGARREELSVEQAAGRAVIRTGPGHRTLWYEIVAP
jgi:hypothetical protein